MARRIFIHNRQSQNFLYNIMLHFLASLRAAHIQHTLYIFHLVSKAEHQQKHGGRYIFHVKHKNNFSFRLAIYLSTLHNSIVHDHHIYTTSWQAKKYFKQELRQLSCIYRHYTTFVYHIWLYKTYEYTFQPTHEGDK